MSLPGEIQAARDWMRAKARFRCGGALGRSKLDPIYIETTQGRDTRTDWHRYSSCGDLLHALAVDVGMPLSTPWVNREAPELGKHWQFDTPENGHRDNISMLWAFGGPMRATPTSWLPECGDWLQLARADGSGVHVCVVGEIGPAGIETFNYGAGGMNPSPVPGSSCGRSRFSTIGSQLWLGQRKVVRCLEIPRLIALVPAGRLPSMTGEEIDALRASVQ